MSRRAVETDGAPRPVGPYSQAIVAGGFVFVAGQGPLDAETGEIRGETVEEQTRYTLENVQAILEAAGASMADVVKTTCHLADLDDFPAFNGIYEDFFPNPKPARTTTGTDLLGILVEIDAVAVLEE